MRILDQGSTIPAPVDYDGILKMEGASGLQSTDSTIVTVIKNNSNEPKVKANTKYTDKQNYKRYKTEIEPNL